MSAETDNWKKPPDESSYDPGELNKSFQVKFRSSLMEKPPVFSELPPKLRAVYVCRKIRMTWPEMEAAFNTPQHNLRNWYRKAKGILEG